MINYVEDDDYSYACVLFYTRDHCAYGARYDLLLHTWIVYALIDNRMVYPHDAAFIESFFPNGR